MTHLYSLVECVDSLNEIMHMKELVAINRDVTDKMRNMWTAWIVYKESRQFIDLALLITIFNIIDFRVTFLSPLFT